MGGVLSHAMLERRFNLLKHGPARTLKRWDDCALKACPQSLLNHITSSQAIMGKIDMWANMRLTGKTTGQPVRGSMFMPNIDNE
jgi:hypothetical protein